MPRWVTVLIVVVLLILIVSNPTGAAAFLSNTVNGIIAFVKSIKLF